MGPEIVFLRGDNAEHLRELIASLSGPFDLISIYACGNHHYCWLRLKKKK